MKKNDDIPNTGFISKWLSCKNYRLRVYILHKLLDIMKQPSKANKMMKCFIDVLLEPSLQTYDKLIVWLKAIIYLLNHYKNVIISNANINRDSIQQQNQNEETKTYGKQLPISFTWYNKADAIGLVLLCHSNVEIRAHALVFLDTIKELYTLFIDQKYLQNQHTIYSPEKRTIGGLIEIISLYPVITECIYDTYIVDCTFSKRLSKIIASYVGIINTTIINMHQQPFHLSHLSNMIVNSKLHETILCTVETLLHLLSYHPPHIETKHGWSATKKWKNEFVREYWISLHCLLFSIVGSGVYNPFNIHNKNDFNTLTSQERVFQQLTFQKFEKYLPSFWICLREESLWITNAIKSIAKQTNWEIIPMVVNSLCTFYDNINSHKSCCITSNLLVAMKCISQNNQYAAGICMGGMKTVELCFKFINDVRHQAFSAGRIVGRGWLEIRTNLIYFYAHYLRALLEIGTNSELRSEFWVFPEDIDEDKIISEIRIKWKNKITHTANNTIAKDVMPHIRTFNVNDRFEAFKWLLDYIDDAELELADDMYDKMEQQKRMMEVKTYIYMALQYLLNCGPQQGSNMIKLLRGSQSLFIDAKNYKVDLFTPLLTFQFESLISYYIEMASGDGKGKHLFGKAIVNVMAHHCEYGNGKWKIKRCKGRGLLETTFHYSHRLILLGFKMIMRSNNMVYYGYLLLRVMAKILVGDSLVVKLVALQSVFHDSSSTVVSVQKNAMVISSYFAQEYPVIAYIFIRVCLQCSANTNADEFEWALKILKPFAAAIHLQSGSRVPEIEHYVERYSELVNKNQLGEYHFGLCQFRKRIRKQL
eukprot:471640_1